MTNIEKKLKDNSFELWNTGGNMMCWGKNLKDGGYILVSDDEGENPTDETEKFGYGIFDDEGEWRGDFFADSLEEVLAIVENN